MVTKGKNAKEEKKKTDGAWHIQGPIQGNAGFF